MSAKTILVVDDEAHILQVVSLKLRNAGYTVMTASDGDEGLEAASTTAVDMVITDYQMPGMTGLELSRRAHKVPGKRDLPVMLLTAHGLALEQVDLAHAGVCCCLSKPFSPREVLAKVESLLQARTAEAPPAEPAPPDHPPSGQ